jgi:hypothetical protein
MVSGLEAAVVAAGAAVVAAGAAVVAAAVAAWVGAGVGVVVWHADSNMLASTKTDTITTSVFDFIFFSLSDFLLNPFVGETNS